MSFSLLNTDHRKVLQHQPVRSSKPVSRLFNLPMCSSSRFGCIDNNSSPYSDSVSLRLRLYCLNLAATNNSLTHSSIGTRSPHIAAELPLPCKLRISGSISLPFLGFFSPFPHGTMRYRCKKVFSLTQWSGRIHAGFLVSDTTQELLRGYFVFKYGTITLYGATFQKLFLTKYTHLESSLADPK